MSYVALARKYRPKTFAEMVGQEHVLKALINALNNGNLHHAYLFTGTRGVGKTTVARIFSKCINNESGITATPDLESQIAKDIDRGSFVDLIEVDAASRTKVDQTRELLENIHYPPSQGRFKVYLIDEVHMLSSHSFNALLKTLEEPPEHIKFLLATTDPQKLPITIVSRCLEFNLKHIPLEQLEKQLTTVLDKETIEHDQGAVHLLAKAGKGSMRDVLSITDQAIAYTNRVIHKEKTASFLGITNRDQFALLVRAIIAGDAKAILKAVDTLAQFLPNYQQLLDDLLLHFQQASIVQMVPDYHLPDQDNNALAREIADKMTPENIQLYYQLALRGKKELDLVVYERSGLEMILLRMLTFSPVVRQNQIKKVTEETQQEAQVSALPVKEQTTEKKEKTPLKLNNLTNDDWLDLYNSVTITGFAYQIIGHAELVESQEDRIVFLIGEKHNELLDTTYQTQIREALEQLFEKDTIQVVFQVQPEAPENSPLMTKKLRHKQVKKQEKELVEQDSEVKALMDQFDATVVETRAVRPEPEKDKPEGQS